MRFASLCTGVVLLALAACGAPGTDGVTGSSSASSGNASSSAALGAMYVNDRERYRIDFPSDWRPAEDDTLVTDDRELSGTAFVAPASLYQGTDLLGAKIHIAVEQDCPSYGQGDMLTIGDRTFVHDEWSGAGAGNRYEGDVYMTDAGASCYVITLYQHACNLGPDCGPDRERPFDDTGLKATFRMMVDSFRFLAGA